MHVLVACEFSGVVRDAFARRGHFAVSCDYERSETTGYHYQGDVLDILTDGWDLMIAHPPCTYLANSGAVWKDVPGRRKKMWEALLFVRLLMSAPIPRICLENPVGAISKYITLPDQMIHPWQFGDVETKKTHLWLKNLPLLRQTKYVPHRLHKEFVNSVKGYDRTKKRSVTFQGIAEAMASQWGRL